MIVVLIIAMLAALAIPAFAAVRNNARKTTCIHNLRLIDHAKEQWAMSNGKRVGDQPEPTDIAVYLRNSILPNCPAGGSYTNTINPIGSPPSCPNFALGHIYP